MRDSSQILSHMAERSKTMNNEKSCCGNAKSVIKGITCDVVTCQYHTGEGHCTAGHIKVGPSQAEVSRETLCTTFKNRTE